MYVNFRMIIFWAALVLCISQSTAWWWGHSDSPQEHPNYLPPAVFYQQRLLKTQQSPYQHMQYSPPGPGEQSAPSMSVPAIPIQVPLQAQFAAMPNIHNVQLVPCLCPVQPEDFDKSGENIYNSKKDV